MSYRLVPMQGFGGLNVRDGADTVGISEAIDLLNVEFAERGAVSQRAGFAKFSDEALTNTPDSLGVLSKVDGTRRLIVGNGNKLSVLATDGSTVASSTSPTASPHFFTRFGSPSVEAVYIANGTDQIRRYETAGGFTAPAGLSGQTGRFLAVQSPDNRLVSARESGTTAGNNPSSVNFSNVGDAETFAAANYVDLRPGDGEQIMGMCSWRELLFVFKESYFAVFWGNTTVGTITTFNVRFVDGGVGLASSRALCVAEDAVYFLDRKGIYRTTGGTAQLVSSPLESFFYGDPSEFFQSSPLNQGSITASAAIAHESRLYFAVPTGSATANDRVLVYDPQGNWWSLYDIPASCLASFRVGSAPELVFGYATGPKLVGRHAFSYRGDQTTAGLTNLVTNPSFETNTTSWGQSAATGTITRTADATAPSGAYVAEAVAPGTNPNEGPYIGPLAGATALAQHTASIWVKSISGATALVLRLEEYTVADAFVARTDLPITVTGAWQRFTVTRTFGASSVKAVIAVFTAGTAAATFRIDGAQIEQAATASTYFDGDTTTANLLPNPSFETSADGYVQFYAGSLTRTADGSASSGSWVASQVCPGTTANEGFNTGILSGATVGAAHTFSAYVKLMSGSGALTLRVAEFTAGGVLVGVTDQNFTATGSYVRVSVSRTFGATGTMAFVGIFTQGATASTFRVDALQLEQAATASTYRDYGSAAYWTGTAHASSSVQLSNAAISSRWRSGWQDFGTPQEKTVREAQLWASGQLTASLSSNFDVATGVEQAIDFTGGSAINEYLMRKAWPGAQFSVEFSNSTANETFTVYRLSYHLREAREPNVVATT